MTGEGSLFRASGFSRIKLTSCLSTPEKSGNGIIKMINPAGALNDKIYLRCRQCADFRLLDENRWNVRMKLACRKIEREREREREGAGGID